MKGPCAWMTAALAAVLAGGAAAGAAMAKDAAGREVVLPAPARRVVSLAPHATELIFAAGGGRALVAVDRDSDYPPPVQPLPRVGDGTRPDAERLLAMRPDLVVAWAYASPAAPGSLPGLLDQFRIPVYYSSPRRLEDIPDEIERLGELLDTSGEARAAAAQLRERLRALAARYAGQPPVRVFYQVGARPMYTISGRSIISDALRLCGAINVFAELPAVAPLISSESVLHAGPEAIAIGQTGTAAEQEVEKWRAFGPALRAAPDHIWTLDPDTMHRPGPRMIEATERLCERIDAVRGDQPAARAPGPPPLHR